MLLSRDPVNLLRCVAAAAVTYFVRRRASFLSVWVEIRTQHVDVRASSLAGRNRAPKVLLGPRIKKGHTGVVKDLCRSKPIRHRKQGLQSWGCLRGAGHCPGKSTDRLGPSVILTPVPSKGSMAEQPYEAARQPTRRRCIAGIKPASRLTTHPSLRARTTVSRHPFPPLLAASRRFQPYFPAASHRL